MGLALVAHSIGASTSGSATTAAVDTTGANLIVICAGTFGGSATLTDNKSNTWTELTQYVSGSFVSRMFYCLNPTVGAGHTFSFGSSFPTITMSAWSGAVSTSVFDTQTGNTSTSASSLSTGSITPTNDNSLIITGVAVTDAMHGTFAIDSGFTITDGQTGVSGKSEGGGQAYLIQTTKAAVNPTWSGLSSSGNIATTIAVFKGTAGGGGGGSTTKFRRTLSALGTRAGSRQVQ